MNRDDIISMAREAGISTDGHPMNPWNVYPSDLEAFAAIVAAAEREACAKVCEELHAANEKTAASPEAEPMYPFDCDDCAAAIRARGGE